MRSRRLLFSSVCVFAVLVSVQVLAQSFAPAVPYGSGGNGPNAVAVADVNGVWHARYGGGELVHRCQLRSQLRGSAVGQWRRNLSDGGGLRFGRALCRLGRGSGR